MEHDKAKRRRRRQQVSLRYVTGLQPALAEIVELAKHIRGEDDIQKRVGAHRACRCSARDRLTIQAEQLAQRIDPVDKFNRLGFSQHIRAGG